MLDTDVDRSGVVDREGNGERLLGRGCQPVGCLPAAAVAAVAAVAAAATALSSTFVA